MTDRTLWPGTWYRASWTVSASLEEDVIGLAALEGCEGARTRRAGPGRVSVEVWFGTLEGAESAVERLASAGHEARGVPQMIRDEGWLEASTAPRQALRAGRFVVLDGRGEAAVSPAGEWVIVLPPGRAFGTGEHETTRMCLELLGDARCAGSRVLDLGTGSGILAIAAALAGSRSVLALDNDPRVLDVARENVVANGVQDRVEVAAGSWGVLAPDACFEIIAANIHRSALVKSARILSERLAEGGRAVLSGFAPADADLVARAWQAAGAREVTRRSEGEWCASAWER